MTDKKTLEELLEQDEGQNLEFKKSLSEINEALESLSAMVNADSAHGIVLFGVEPDRTPCGVEPGNLDSAQRTISQKVGQKIDPTLLVEISVLTWRGKHIITLKGNRGKDIPYHEYDGRAWIRQGSENVRLGISEKEQLRTRRNRDSHPGPWKCNRCGSYAGTLSGIVLTKDGLKKCYDCHCGGEFWPAD